MLIQAKSTNVNLDVPEITVPVPRYKSQVSKSAGQMTLDVSVENSDKSYKFQKIKTMKFVNPVIADFSNKKSVFNLIDLKSLEIGGSTWSNLIIGEDYFNTSLSKIIHPSDEDKYTSSCLIGGEAIEYIVRNYITQSLIKDVILRKCNFSFENPKGIKETITVCEEEFPATSENIANLNRVMYKTSCDLFALYKNPLLLLNSIQDTIYILPEAFRPSAIDRKNPLTDHYNKLISSNNTLMSVKGYAGSSIKSIMLYYKNNYYNIVDVFKTSNSNSKSYKPLLKRLSGKHGLIREHMIGTRCDYTARCVITVDKDMPSGYVGIPRNIITTIYENVLMNEKLLDNGFSKEKLDNYLKNETLNNIESFADIMNGCPVLIGRQPTLFYLGIQLRKIKIVEGLAMVMSPLDIVAFGADFDGDAMHITALTDAKRVRGNDGKALRSGDEYIWESEDSKPFDGLISLFYPKDGKPTVDFRHEILYGLNISLSGVIEEKNCDDLPGKVTSFDDIDMCLTLLEKNLISPTTKVGGYTVAQGIIGFCLNISEGEYSSIALDNDKFDFTGKVTSILKQGQVVHSPEGDIYSIDWYRYAVNVLVKFGFAVSKLYSASIDLVKLDEVKGIESDYDNKISDIRERVYKIQKSSLFRDTDKSRVKAVYSSLEKTDKNILANLNNDWTRIIGSGARGQMSNIQQSFLNKGTIGHCSDSIRSNIILSNYSNGLTCYEGFIAANGGRADLIAKNISAAGPGYLARLMSFDSADIIINGQDCGTELTFDFDINDISNTQDHIKHAIDKDGNRILSNESLKQLEGFMSAFLVGRFIKRNNSDVKVTKENFNEIFNYFTDGNKIQLYSPIFCNNRCCRKCYGDDIRNIDTGLNNGVRVGLISAQAVAEPMTQMTMKLFQSGGVERSGDLDSDIDKVLSLFSGSKENAVESARLDDEDSFDDGESEMLESELNYRDIVLKTLKVINIYWKAGHKVNMKHIEIVMSSFMRFIDAKNPGPGYVRKQNTTDILMFYGIKKVTHKSGNFMNRIALENLSASISSSLLYDDLAEESLIEKETLGKV